MTILICRETEVRNALKRYPEEFVNGVDTLVLQLCNEDAISVSNPDLNLLDIDSGVRIERYETTGVLIEFEDPEWTRRPDIGTCGSVTYMDDEDMEEKTLIRVGVREKDWACNFSGDGEVFDCPTFNALTMILNAQLGGDTVKVNRKDTIDKIYQTLKYLRGADLLAVLKHVEGRAPRQRKNLDLE